MAHWFKWVYFIPPHQHNTIWRSRFKWYIQESALSDANAGQKVNNAVRQDFSTLQCHTATLSSTKHNNKEANSKTFILQKQSARDVHIWMFNGLTQFAARWSGLVLLEQQIQAELYAFWQAIGGLGVFTLTTVIQGKQ